MWDWRQLNWLNWYFGWWPRAAKSERWRWLSKYLGILLYAFDFGCLGPEFYGLYDMIQEGSLKGAIVNLSTSLMGIICMLKIYQLIFNSHKIIDIIESLEELENSLLPKLIDNGSNIKQITTKANQHCAMSCHLAILVCLGLSHWMLRPLILLVMYGIKTTAYQTYLFWSIDNLPGWTILYIVQNIHAFSAMAGLILFDSVFMSISELVIVKFKFLAIALQQIDYKRCEDEQEVNTTTRGQLEKCASLKYENKTKNDEITLDLCVKYHQKLLSIIESFKRLTDIIQIVQIALFTAIFCISIYEGTSMKGVTVTKVMNIFELDSCFLVDQLMYCYYSCEMAYWSTEIGMFAYMSNWYDGTQQDQKKLLLMVERTKKKQIFGDFLCVDLDTYLQILKTTFSYYNVIKALDIT